MKKVYSLLLCLVIVPMLFAGNDAVNPQTPLETKGPTITNTPAVDYQPQTNPSNRALLFEQVGDTMGGSAYACQQDSVYPFEGDITDDVVPTNTWNVDTVEVWMGYWGSWVGWNLVPHVNFIVYPDVGGAPADSPSVELIVEAGTYQAFAGGIYSRLLMPLPSTVVLTAGTTYWLEWQPHHSFAANGQTGNQAMSGAFGNGQELYFRFPVLGVPSWVTATQQWGEPLECYFRLYGSAGGTYTDAATTAILSPPTSVMPSTVHAPEATYANNSTSGQTFDCYYIIDSSGVNLYSQTANVTLPSGTDTTITWPNWTAGPNDGITYDITAWVELAGDENHANDTLTQQTVTASLYWEILDPPLFPAPASGHACGTMNDGTYHVFSCGGGYNEVQIYDIASNTWSAGTSNPTGAGQYCAAGYVIDKFYRVGGWNGTAADGRVDIYDPGADSWASGTAAPTAIIDCASGVYNDSHLYTIGGGNWYSSVAPHNMVHCYDVVGDAWTSCTAIPGAPRGCPSGGIIDSFIIVAFGYDGGAMRIDYVVGVIDGTTPSTITWGTPTDVPNMDSLYRTPSAVDISNQELWITCGQKWTVQINRTWSYSPYTDTWTEWAYPKPIEVANVTPVVVTTSAAGDLGLFVPGGYFGGGPVSDHEVFHTGKYGIEEKPGENSEISGFGFAPNMPNPVKGYSPITYTTTSSGSVTLKIYDGTGRLVKTLVNRQIENAGTKTVYWNGNDESRRSVANGVYFLQLEAEGQRDTYKLVVVK